MSKILDRSVWWGWGALGMLLPFTSLPLLAGLRGASMVAPPSVLFLGAIGLIWFLPFVLRRGALPGQSAPLLYFLLAALGACLLSMFYDLPPLKDVSPLRGMFQAFLTLLIGIGFYLLSAAWFQQENRLSFFLRVLNWSGLLILVWCGVQVWAWNKYLYYPEWMWSFQEKVSSSYLLFSGRVTGFAYEPSWLGHQLNMFYLPVWISASIRGYTAHGWRLWKISLENILMVGGGVMLWMSISRIGYLTFIAMAGFLFLGAYIQLVSWIRSRILKETASRVVSLGISILISLVLFVVYAGILFAAAYWLSKVDPRMATLFNFSALKDSPLFVYANQLVFAERLVFWQAGWEIFNDFPFFGVGLGNAGFFFTDKLSANSWALTEVSTLMFRWSSIPNIKSLWVRLLAETGLVGFSFFCAWLYLVWLSARQLMSSKERQSQAMGLAGCLVLCGMVVEGFNLDTFALPYIWLLLGMVTGACQRMRREAVESQ